MGWIGKVNHLDLFSGIGGFSLAADWVWENDHKIIGFCEIDKFCQKVLKKHWPGVPIYDDIKKLDGKQFGTVDLLTGGFPCQPFSVAGKRKGQEDDRALWPEMFRIIQESKPHWIIGENVGGFIDMGLDDCISSLENEGYEVQAFIIPACAVNAPHRRDRVWICAHSINGEHGTIRGQDGNENSISGIDRQTLRSGRVIGTGGNASHSTDTGIKNLRERENPVFQDADATDTEGRETQSAKQGRFHAESGGTDSTPKNTLNRGMRRRDNANTGRGEAHYKLRDQIAMLPTATNRDYKSGKGKCQEERDRKAGSSLSETIEAPGKKIGLKLQPAFVEWMMGYPQGWTELTD